MIRVLACFLLIALTVAEEAQPTNLESTFFGGLFGAAQNLATQELFQRRFADINLGLQVAQGFHSFALAEHQKHIAATTLDLDDDDLEQQAPKPKRAIDFANKRFARSEEAELEEIDELNADEFLELSEVQNVDFEQQSTDAKNHALKALHMQLYLTASDVEKSYWLSKMFAVALPPQYATFKIYKSYLNTIALSSAYQFHDAYTFESLLDDFNDKFAVSSSVLAEPRAEYTVYQNWMSLATIKWQLFMLSIYEQSMASSMVAANSHAAAASSFLETEEQLETEFVGMPAQTMVAQYAYMTYYVMMLKYYSLFTELSLAQTGLHASQLKVHIAQHAETVDDKLYEQLEQLEGQVLPQLYMQWSSTNQMKYMFEYYMLMMDMQSPQIAQAQAVQRAENSFLNLFQSQNAETTTAAPATN